MDKMEKIKYLKKELAKRGYELGNTNFEYWQYVPCAFKEDKEIVLAERYLYMHAFHIKTIWDYKTKQGMKNYLNKLNVV